MSQIPIGVLIKRRFISAPRFGKALLVTFFISSALFVSWHLVAFSQVAPGIPPASLPKPDFIFGFNQVAGSYYLNPRGIIRNETTWTLTDAELATMRDDFGVNAIRFFVTPWLVGIPQASWNGPLSIRYTDYQESQFVWDRPNTTTTDSLFEIIRKLRQYDIMPILMMWPVDEYVSYMNRTDLRFLNGTSTDMFGRVVTNDYTGIVPEEQVKHLSTIIAKNVYRNFGSNFGIIFTEICGQGDPARKRIDDGEKARWQRIFPALRQAAPGAYIFSPELCASIWHWAEVGHRYWGEGNKTCSLPFDYQPRTPVGEDWPKGLLVKDYAEIFDVVSTSLFDSDPKPCETNRVRAGTDATLKIIRKQAIEPFNKKWFWAEAGWGSFISTAEPADINEERLHASWAMNLFGSDNMAGILIWQAKNNEGSGAGLWTETGAETPSYDFVRKLSRVVVENKNLLRIQQPILNGDGFFVSTNQFTEADPNVYTRRLGEYLIIYSLGPQQAVFTQTAGQRMTEYANRASLLDISYLSGGATMTVKGFQSNRLYVLKNEILPSPSPSPSPTPRITPSPTPTPAPTPTSTPTPTPTLSPFPTIRPTPSPTPTKPPIPDIPPGYRFTKPLYFGLRNQDVLYLQIFLKAQDTTIYPEGLVTGYYGQLTRQAVIRFQTKYGIPQLGVVGPITRAKINELIK